jgi:tetratricopeptide (TPR) repeat protein
MVSFLLAAIALAAVSCQSTVPVRKPQARAVLQTTHGSETWQVTIKEWEDYLSFATDGKEVTVDIVITILRFTDSYFDAKEILYRRAVREYDERLRLFNKGSLRSQPRVPKRDYTKLIKYFRYIRRGYQSSYGSDALLYAIAYALYDEGREDEAMRTFEQLVMEYPPSTYFIEASFRLGEYYYDMNRNIDAIDAYLRVLEFPESGFYDKALYKTGWLYYRIDEIERSATAFLEAFERQGSYKKGGLQDEALSGVVMSLGRFIDHSRSLEFLNRRGTTDSSSIVYSKLADRLVEETRYREALLVYRSFIDKFPISNKLPFIYDRMARLHDSLGEKEKSIDMRFLLITKFNPDSLRAGGDIDTNEKLAKLVAGSIVTLLGQSQRAAGVASTGGAKDLGALNRIIRVARIYNESFFDGGLRAEVTLALADALFEMEYYQQAAVEYENAVGLEQDPQKIGEIAYSAFLTYEIIFYRYDKDKRETSGIARKLAMTLSLYRSQYERIGKLDQAIYKLADVYARTGNYTLASTLVADIARGKDAARAYKKAADFALSGGDVLRAEPLYANLVKVEGGKANKEKLAAIRYKLAKGLLEAGDKGSARDKFNEAYATHRSSKVSESALIMLARIEMDLGVDDGFRAFRAAVKRIVRDVPESKAPVALLVEAGQLAEADDPAIAAGLYDFAANLVVSGKADGLKLSRTGYSLFFASALLYEKAGMATEQEKALRSALRGEGVERSMRPELTYRLGYLQMELGRRSSSLRTLRSLTDSDRPGNLYVIKARLLQLTFRLDDYKEVRLTRPFQKTLKKKTALIERLVRDYTRVAAKASQVAPEVLPQIFFSMGSAFENFRDSIVNSDRPRDLTKEEKIEYEFLVEEMAYPYDERAVEAYEKTLRAALVQSLYDRWLYMGVARLAYLRPALYKRSFDERGLEPLYQHEVVGGDKLRPLVLEKPRKVRGFIIKDKDAQGEVP